jgi:hypothetical protein
MSSVFNMVSGVAGSFGTNISAKPCPLSWDDPRLLWVVREPFVSRTSEASLTAGLLEKGAGMEVQSMTPSGGVIFSDGIESDFLEFNSGTIARIGVASERATLVVK